jgi:hypothetical protein
MAIAEETRQAVSERFNFACGYCGVSEIDAGSELEVDHFQPSRRGGSDEWDNLVYACPACNRNKAVYWPLADTPPHMHLLHPSLDNLAIHITLLPDGSLTGLTPRGWFHIEWLHLNRPQLIALRQKQAFYQRSASLIEQMQQINHQLREIVASQKEELDALREEVHRLTRNDS